MSFVLEFIDIQMTESFSNTKPEVSDIMKNASSIHVG
jgi:hypothetical protein